MLNFLIRASVGLLTSMKCLMESPVEQRTENWHRWRRKAIVTASRFGDAAGLGIGKAYEYFLAYISPREDVRVDNEWTRHGIKTEPIINEMYQLLAGRKTQPSGFWMPLEDDLLYNLSGCSPDGKVVGTDGEVIGLVEYKAPVYCNYSVKKHPPYGIPRQYMAQIQGQMGICRLPWCDFMSVCLKTEEMSLFRVHFQPSYYAALTRRLACFCAAVQDYFLLQPTTEDIESLAAVRHLKELPVADCFLTGEDRIAVDVLIVADDHGRYRTSSGMWMTFDFLTGNESSRESFAVTSPESGKDGRMTNEERRKVVDEIDFELALTTMDVE